MKKAISILSLIFTCIFFAGCIGLVTFLILKLVADGLIQMEDFVFFDHTLFTMLFILCPLLLIGSALICLDAFLIIRKAKYKEDLRELGVALLFFGFIALGVLVLIYCKRLPSNKIAFASKVKLTGKRLAIKVISIIGMAVSLFFSVFLFIFALVATLKDGSTTDFTFIMLVWASVLFPLLAFTFNYLNYRNIERCVDKKQALRHVCGTLMTCAFVTGIISLTTKDENFEDQKERITYLEEDNLEPLNQLIAKDPDAQDRMRKGYGVKKAIKILSIVIACLTMLSGSVFLFLTIRNSPEPDDIYTAIQVGSNVIISFISIGVSLLAIDTYRIICKAKYKEDIRDLGIAQIFFGFIALGILILVYTSYLPSNNEAFKYKAKAKGKQLAIKVFSIIFMVITLIVFVLFLAFFINEGVPQHYDELFENDYYLMVIFAIFVFTYYYLIYQNIGVATNKKEANRYVVGSLVLCFAVPAILTLTSKDEDYKEQKDRIDAMERGDEEYFEELRKKDPKTIKKLQKELLILEAQRLLEEKKQAIEKLKKTEPIEDEKPTNIVPVFEKEEAADLTEITAEPEYFSDNHQENLVEEDEEEPINIENEIKDEFDILLLKLEKIKTLFDENLIDEEEYKFMKKNVFEEKI